MYINESPKFDQQLEGTALGIYDSLILANVEEPLHMAGLFPGGKATETGRRILKGVDSEVI